MSKAEEKNSGTRKLRLALATALAACAALLGSGCTSGVAYDEFVSLAKANWDKDSLAVFRAEMTDTTGAYDIMIQVRNDNDYAFANLWLFIDVVSPDGHTRRDTLECVLAKADGTWLGGGWGSLYTLRCPYMPQVRFARPGPYTFRLTQGMRKDQLKGIHDIGLLIERHKEEQ